MNINALGPYAQIYSGLSARSKTSLPQEKSSTLPANTDRVEISPEAKTMSDTGGNQSLSKMLDTFMDGAGEDGVITLEEIRAYGDEYRKKAEQVLNETLKELGISSDQKISIQTDAEGKVRVSGDLPESSLEKLEQALNDHPDFQQHYTKAASSASLVQAAEQYIEFAEAYDKDPQAAVARYSAEVTASDFLLEYFNGETRMVQASPFTA